MRPHVANCAFCSRSSGYEVKTFGSAKSFLEVAPVLVPGCVVLDIRGHEAGELTIPRS